MFNKPRAARKILLIFAFNAIAAPFLTWSIVENFFSDYSLWATLPISVIGGFILFSWLNSILLTAFANNDLKQMLEDEIGQNKNSAVEFFSSTITRHTQIGFYKNEPIYECVEIKDGPFAGNKYYYSGTTQLDIKNNGIVNDQIILVPGIIYKMQ